MRVCNPFLFTAYLEQFRHDLPLRMLDDEQSVLQVRGSKHRGKIPDRGRPFGEFPLHRSGRQVVFRTYLKFIAATDVAEHAYVIVRYHEAHQTPASIGRHRAVA